ncbi:bifunctional serine/threonine-protein kinase/universal stress protein [Prosthecomicrobium sp. N25]|uniref:bifunctional serine/threonine-protein kinase/universal stress protein n=1 Tax=Prosthecomicrobium sp. N25 TaxID=3129254 RepID=UPI003076C05E
MQGTDLAPGLVIDGFTLTERLSFGGMGAVWRATKPGVHVPVVLKVPFIAPGDDVSAVIGFEVEEMILKRLKGPHVPRFLGSGDLETLPYIAMEYVAGDHLQKVMESAPFSWQTVAHIGADIAAALDAIHQQKVAHLDLKPANIIQSPRGVVLIDFGLARHEELPDLLGEETRLPVGTPAYIAPEQVLGDRSNNASDLFALGCILYELATGEKPFGEPSTRAGMERRIYRAPPPPRAVVRGVPRFLQEIILHCLEVDPARRYATAAQVLFDLRNPGQVVITERGRLDRGDSFLRRVFRALLPFRAKPMPPRPAVMSRRDAASVVMAAVDLARGEDPLAEEVRLHVARVMEGVADARLACVTIMKTRIAGEDETVDAAGRNAYVGRLVALKDWARPLGIPDDKVSYHVIEAVDVAAALIRYAEHNRVDHIVLGARASSALRRHLGSVSAQVVAEAHASVTVVRVKSQAEAVSDEEAADIAGERAEA